MDAVRLGRSYRALRRRRGWRQRDLASESGLSKSSIGRIELGQVRGVDLPTFDRLAGALGASLDVQLRWNGEGLDRLLDEAHAEAVAHAVRIFARAGWQTAVEVSFAIRGERGSVDVLAFHAATRRLAVVEVKSMIPDAGNTIQVLDRKTRLGREIAAHRGWRPDTVARLLVVVDSRTARRRVEAHADLFATAFPLRGRAVTAWIADPSSWPVGAPSAPPLPSSPPSAVSALYFLPVPRRAGHMSPPAITARSRVRRRSV